MTFDWAQVAYIGSPLLTPCWAAANVVGGLIIVMWFIAQIMCMLECWCDHFVKLTILRLQQCSIFCLYAYLILLGFRQHGQAL